MATTFLIHVERDTNASSALTERNLSRKGAYTQLLHEISNALDRADYPAGEAQITITIKREPPEAA